MELALWISLALSGLCLMLLVFLAIRGNKPLEIALREEFSLNRREAASAAQALREEIASGRYVELNATTAAMGEMARAQNTQLSAVAGRIKEFSDASSASLERLRVEVGDQLARMRESNERKLDQMRETVDEKLHSTLEKRLGESFRMVGERLEAVQRGLGEMQSLAAGVGDLKRVLSNVKARGTWGEVQLGALLEQMLTPDQFCRNVRIKEKTAESVEYAIRLPGADDAPDSFVWLPIDAKFPQEDYLRLLEASEAGNAEATQAAVRSLMRSVRASAESIRDKYIDPPRTTDFALMFLPTEGLYAEVLRQPGQVESLQQEYRVVVAGPTTLAAILSSLRMGFRTLAIGRRSSEVWKILGAVKTEFSRFGDVLGRVRRQLAAASNTIEQTGVRTRAMVKKLREVEQLPGEQSAELLDLPSEDANDEACF